MSPLVEQLKLEHVQITESLNRVTALGISKEEGQAALRVAKYGLLAHLKKEDERFYPALHTAAQSDPDLKRVLHRFASDMEAISKAAHSFFEKYAQGGAGIEFARDFGRLLANLSDRMSREEHVLYNKYDELRSAGRPRPGD